jgi:hypothetical protein
VRKTGEQTSVQGGHTHCPRLRCGFSNGNSFDLCSQTSQEARGAIKSGRNFVGAKNEMLRHNPTLRLSQEDGTAVVPGKTKDHEQALRKRQEITTTE